MHSRGCARVPRAIGCTFACLLLTISTVTRADTAPHQVRDINQVRIPESSNPQYLGLLNGRMLFGATDREGAGLWSTDGTSAGTHLLTRVDVFAQRQFPGSPMFIVQNGLGYFVGDDASTGVFELWVTDGTGNGTKRLTQHAPSVTSYSGFYDFIGVLHGRVLFFATDANNVMQVWSTDGTAAGTVQVSQAGAEAPSLVLPDRVYFASGTSLGGVGLWVSDGTPQGTQAVQIPSLQFPFYSIQSFVTAGSLPMFASNELLWAIDPGTESVIPVTFAGAQGYPNQPPADEAVSLGAVVISLGTNATLTGGELWRSDGTPAGTYRLAVVNAGLNGSIPQPLPIDLLVTVHGHALTVARDPSGNLHLLGTDGTMAGTVTLLDLPPPPNTVTPDLIPFRTIGDFFYFAVADDATAQSFSMWRSDGTVQGTRRISLPGNSYTYIGLTQLFDAGKHIFMVPGAASPSEPLLDYDPATNSTRTVEPALPIPTYESAVGTSTQLYFSANDPKVGNEPWVSDGTPGGTHLIRDINPEWSDYPSNPNQFVDFDGKLAFVADDGVHGRELWISDGSAQGTHLLADVVPGPVGSNPTELTVRGRDLYFFATDAGGVQRLMKLHAGTTHPEVLAALAPPPSPQPPYYQAPCAKNAMVTLGRRLYFAASDATSGVELWSTDGTASGTRQVADIYPGALSSNPCQLTRMGGRIFFSATSALGTELWRSDGTASGTWQVADLAPGDLSSFPSDLTAWHGDLYFDLADGSHGAQIWRSDGTAAGTKLFVDLAPGNLNAFGLPAGTLPRYLLLGSFVPDSSGFSYTSSLWSTDGSPGKPVLLSGNYVAGPLTLGETALFFANETQGVEPWITNGTVSGTRRLANISPDLRTYVDWLIPFGPGAAFTTLEAGASGTEVLWRTDGTQSGTVRVGTIPIPNEASYFDPTQRLAIGPNLFFVGTTPSTGDELWVYEHCFGAARYSDSGSTVCRHTPH